MSNTIRIHPLLARGETVLQGLSSEQLQGAELILASLSDVMNDLWFTQHIEYDRKALVKTLQELWEISVEMTYREQNKNKNA